DRAEELLGIAGEAGVDPTEPVRSRPYRYPVAPLAAVGTLIAEAAAALGLHPFRIPMAINVGRCQSCTTCDAFACAVEAKNDLATRVIPGLLEAGMTLRPGTVVTRLQESGSRIVAIEAVDVNSGRRLRYVAERVILAAGALATPHLLLASGLDRASPGGWTIGRFLMLHCNAMTYGYFPTPPNTENAHHKQIAIHDFYFGDPSVPHLGKLGNIQQVMAPPAGLLRAMLPAFLAGGVSALVANLTGLLTIAEDQPRQENGIELHRRRRDRFGLPAVRIRHRYTPRDLSARRALVRRARQVLRQAGSVFNITWNVNTFSHAVGTARMGEDPRTSAVDRFCRLHGIENLWVT